MTLEKRASPQGHEFLRGAGMESRHGRPDREPVLAALLTIIKSVTSGSVLQLLGICATTQLNRSQSHPPSFSALGIPLWMWTSPRCFKRLTGRLAGSQFAQSGGRGGRGGKAIVDFVDGCCGPLSVLPPGAQPRGGKAEIGTCPNFLPRLTLQGRRTRCLALLVFVV